MIEVLITFLPVAALLTVTPGVATALVIRSAARGGRREAVMVTLGNSLGVLAWAGFAAVGIAAAEGMAFVPAAMAMAGLIVALDLLWYSTLAWGVARARRAFVEGPWLARAERLTGGVLVGLGLKLAFERR